MNRSLDGHVCTGNKKTSHKKFGLPGKEKTDSPMKGGTMKNDSKKRQRAHDASHLTGLAAENLKNKSENLTVSSDRLWLNLG